MSRDKILSSIKKNIKQRVKRDDINIDHTTYEDPLKEFIKNLKLNGGDIGDVDEGIVLKASFGVAENGAIYIDHKQGEDRKIYTFYDTITVRLNKNDIVNNMNEAYKKVKIDEFGIFISGPSKTADIEQSLVIGAHGAKILKVIFEG